MQKQKQGTFKEIHKTQIRKTEFPVLLLHIQKSSQELAHANKIAMLPHTSIRRGIVSRHPVLFVTPSLVYSQILGLVTHDFDIGRDALFVSG